MSGEERKPHREGFAPKGKQEPPDEADDEFLMGEDIGDDDVFYDDDVCIDDENDSTLNGNSSLEDDSTPIVEAISSMEEESLSTVEDRPPTVQRKDPTVEEKRPSMEEEGPTSDKQLPTEKECQTVDQGVVYKLVSTADEENEPVEELPSAKQDGGFFDKGCQTKSIIDDKPQTVRRKIKITVRLERSSSSSSLNATGYDSGNTLKDCPSIEEEEVPPEPVEGILLRITAQVMVRNDSTGGWVPEGSGGISVVTITKIETPHRPNYEGPIVNKYMVRGRKISDNRVTLTCCISEHFQYNKVMPTFHHWKSGDEKFGLTFLTKFEARSFDKVLREAVYAYLLELDPNALPIEVEGDDDEEFLAFTKPLEKKKKSPSPPVTNKTPVSLPPYSEEEEKMDFMQLTNLPEYRYIDGRSTNNSETERLKQRPMHRTRKPLRLFGRVRRETRLRCKFCHELYEEEDNGRGQCRYAPSRMRDCIDFVSCSTVARECVAGCTFDPLPDYAHPCTCQNDGTRGLRWFGLCVLSIFFPCIMLYPILKGCYNCGTHCGVCGGRHQRKPVVNRRDQVIYY